MALETPRDMQCCGSSVKIKFKASHFRWKKREGTGQASTAGATFGQLRVTEARGKIQTGLRCCLLELLKILLFRLEHVETMVA